MENLSFQNLRTEFAKRAELLREEDRRVADFKRKKDKDRDEEQDQEADELDDMVVIMATDAELSDFEIELDAYEAATVEALTDNTEAMTKLGDNIERMLGEAYVLPDGRRVFKTEDGLRVFDENGTELSAEDIDPNVVEDTRPSWEDFSSLNQQYEALGKERQQLIDYQQDLDTARERLKAGDVTAEELRAMDDDLRRDLPDAVAKVLPEDMQDEPVAEAEIVSEPASFRPGVRLDMPDL